MLKLSYKNKLNEYCQKHKLNYPIYQTYQKNGKWFCNCTLLSVNIETLFSQIDTIGFMSKLQAEQKSAELILDQINNISIPEFNQYHINHIYIIDLENISCYSINQNNDSLYIGFIGKLHNCIDKYIDNNWFQCYSDNLYSEITNSSSRLILYTVDSDYKDQVDHMMTMFLYPLLNYIFTLDIKPYIHIVTGDHAGFCTKKCLSHILNWYNITDIIVDNIRKF